MGEENRKKDQNLLLTFSVVSLHNHILTSY